MRFLAQSTVSIKWNVRLRHHSATPAWRNLNKYGTLQLKFKMAETMIKSEIRVSFKKGLQAQGGTKKAESRSASLTLMRL